VYARAQTQMSRLRDMATRGMKSAAAAAAAAATEMKSMANKGAYVSGSPSQTRQSGYSAFNDVPSSGRDGNAVERERHTSRDNPRRDMYGQTVSRSVSDSTSAAARLAERLDAGAAAAEILFDMRVSSRSEASVTDPGKDSGMTAEELETLNELRFTCEDHLNTLARVVESGGVDDDALLQRAIEVAESLVAAIGDDETVAAAAAAEDDVQGQGYAPPTQDLSDLPHAFSAVGGAERDTLPETGVVETPEVADLLGGLDVGGATPTRAPAAERPSTEAEEEAMVAAAIAASLAEAQPAAADQAQQQTQTQTQQTQPPANLIDF
jgi:hypothetical protein